MNDSIEYELVEALEVIETICEDAPDSDVRRHVLVVVRAALDKADHHARLREMGAFNDE